jgi:cell division septum initiation protein DivIVA
MENKDVFRHLVGVEREAADLVGEAQKESDRLIDEAKRAGVEAYKTAYESKLKILEAELKEKKEALVAAHDRSVADYEKGLESLAESPEAFSAFVDSLLSTEA